MKNQRIIRRVYDKLRITLVMVLPFSLLAQPDSLRLQRLSPEEVRVYYSVEDMLEREGMNCFQELSVSQGFAFWGYKFAYRSGGQWMVLESNQLNVNAGCEAGFMDLQTIHINKTGRPEVIIRLAMQEYGSRGGTDYEYIQVWDVDIPALILEAVTKDHFAWFSSEEDESLCERKIECRPGEIQIDIWQCSIGDGEEPNDPIIPGIYKWINGQYIRME